MRWWSYRARWGGVEYAANPEPRRAGLWVRLLRDQAADGFEEIAPGRHVRQVPVIECDVLVFVTMVCEWSGVPCQVRAERSGELLVEYTGGQAPVARYHGFERLERGVYRRWIPRHEARGLRENTVVLHPAEPPQPEIAPLY